MPERLGPLRLSHPNDRTQPSPRAGNRRPHRCDHNPCVAVEQWHESAHQGEFFLRRRRSSRWNVASGSLHSRIASMFVV